MMGTWRLDIRYQKFRGPNFLVAALRASLTSSIAPFGRSGRVTQNLTHMLTCVRLRQMGCKNVTNGRTDEQGFSRSRILQYTLCFRSQYKTGNDIPCVTTNVIIDGASNKTFAFFWCHQILGFFSILIQYPVQPCHEVRDVFNNMFCKQGRAYHELFNISFQLRSQTLQ